MEKRRFIRMPIVTWSFRAIRLGDVRDRSASQPAGCHRASLVDRAKQRSGLDTGRVQPLQQRLDRASNVTARNGDSFALAFLVIVGKNGHASLRGMWLI